MSELARAASVIINLGGGATNADLRNSLCELYEMRSPTPVEWQLMDRAITLARKDREASD